MGWGGGGRVRETVNRVWCEQILVGRQHTHNLHMYSARAHTHTHTHTRYPMCTPLYARNSLLLALGLVALGAVEEEDGEEGRIEERDHAILHRVREQAPGPRGGEFEDVVEVPRDAPEPGGEEEGAAFDLLAGLGVGDRVEGFDVSGSSMRR